MRQTIIRIPAAAATAGDGIDLLITDWGEYPEVDVRASEGTAVWTPGDNVGITARPWTAQQ